MPRKGPQEYVLVINRHEDSPIISTHHDPRELVGRLIDWMGNEIERKYGGAPWIGYRKFLAEGNIAEAAKCFFYVAGGRWDAYHHKLGDTDAILAAYQARREQE
ncbi:MAG: hypothetical protein ACM359_14070 [Bacillota bacterium]